MNIKVSVITPFLNGLPYLEECVNSVLAQTLPEIELILIDDGSTDGSGELADQFAKKDSRVRVIHQQNKGVSAARNAGLEIAQGDYIGFVDSDDFIKPGMYAELFGKAKYFNADIVTAGSTTVYSDGRSDDTKKPPFQSNFPINKFEILKMASTMHASRCFVAVWRSIFNTNLVIGNHIRFNECVAIGEDTLFCMNCYLLCERAVSCDNMDYCYRIHQASTMRKKHNPLLNSSLQLQYEKKLELCEKYFIDYYDLFCSDAAKYNLTALLPFLLGNIYHNSGKRRFETLKSVGTSPMIKKSFIDFDIGTIRSKSLDYIAMELLRRGHYFGAHLIYRFIIFKRQQ